MKVSIDESREPTASEHRRRPLGAEERSERGGEQVSTAVLSIGSNLGDRLAHLRACVAELAPWLRAVSGVYETAPWGPVPQEDYLNAVVLVADGAADPRDWLARAQAAERHAGRTRELRWGPRTLDVDVIAVDAVR